MSRKTKYEPKKFVTMKKNYLLISILILMSAVSYAAQFTITPTGNLTYSPMVTNATVGDTIHMIASFTHPVVEVSQATYNSNGNTPLPGGFGFHTATFDLIVTNAGTIYFVCDNHNSSGMKGQIVVTASGVNEVTNANNVKFLSNPSRNGRVNVLNTLGKPGLLYIFNMLGKLQLTEKLTGVTDQVISVDLPSGNYLCKFILEGNWTRTEKLIISDQLN